MLAFQESISMCDYRTRIPNSRRLLTWLNRYRTPNRIIDSADLKLREHLAYRSFLRVKT